MSSINLIPRTEDGREISAPIAFAEGMFVYICGAGDHATNGRGEGNRFRLSRSTQGESTVEWSYNDPVWITGGVGRTSGGQTGDEFSVECYAPATEVEAVTPGTGTCILYDTGFMIGQNVLYSVVPYPGGTHNVTKAIPVPASVGEPSAWLWTPPATMVGAGDITAKESGGWNLYTSDIPLARQAAHLQLMGEHDLTVDVGNVKPLISLPQWKFKAVLTVDGSRDVAVSWTLKVSRYRTTQIW